jgi:hypothetical protein
LREEYDSKGGEYLELVDLAKFSLSLREEYDSKGGEGMKRKKNVGAAEKLCDEFC